MTWNWNPEKKQMQFVFVTNEMNVSEATCTRLMTEIIRPVPCCIRFVTKSLEKSPCREAGSSLPSQENLSFNATRSFSTVFTTAGHLRVS